MIRQGLTVLLALWALTAMANDLEKGFVSPPDSAKPWTFWWWLEGNISKKGITRDLEEMKRQGINGVVIFNGGAPAGPMPKGVGFLTTEWKDFFKHALSEADRLGMNVSVNLCDGWCCGGPWIKPDQANKKLVYAEVQTEGPGLITRVLPKPPTIDGYYHDVAVVAFRANPEHPLRPAEITANSNLPEYVFVSELNYPPANAADGDPETYWSSANATPTLQQPIWLTLNYHEPLAVDAVYVAPAAESGPRDCELQQSADGHTFTTVCRFTMDNTQAKQVKFSEVSAPHFRLVITSAYGTPVRLAEVILLRKGDRPILRPGIKWWPTKSGSRGFWHWPQQGPAVLEEEYAADGTLDCRSSEIVDLSDRIDANGNLKWHAPDGRWSIIRFGYTLLGQRIRGSSAGTPAGYEADMLGSAGIECQFKTVAEPLLAIAPEAVGRSWKSLHIDSYELGADIAGLQPTWSDQFRFEFKARRGYDLLPYLPALAGRVVDSREKTDRFLWDIRKTIADLMRDKFWSRYAELAHAAGLAVQAETGYGSYPLPHIDSLQCAGAMDVPMAEFWVRENYLTLLYPYCNVMRTVASAAHTYGRPIVQAESFTTFSHFMESPADLKPVGDRAFCDGLNRVVFHQSTHQPQLDFKPGYQYSAGTHIDRNLTWWEQSRAYFEYIGRCQHLLQAGRFRADVCYFYGEGSATYVPAKDFLKPPLLPGLNFDGIDANTLLNRLVVKDKRLVLPDGANYRILVLPESRTMSPGLLKKIIELVKTGATVLGSRPFHAPGLEDYPRCDEELTRLADELWGTANLPEGMRTFGKGRIFWGKTPGEILRSDGVKEDLEVAINQGSSRDATPASIPPFLDFTHRTTGDTDIYFVANQNSRGETLDCTFRVDGKQPEIWDPVTGTMRDAVAFRQTNGRTLLPLEFAPNGSLFIVFRKPIPVDRHGSAQGNFPVMRKVKDIAGPWMVRFDTKWGGPASITFQELEDWTKRQEEGIKYYSGKATYLKEFDLKPGIVNSSSRLFLDLGDVKNVAQVRLNGGDLGVVWTAPKSVDITDTVRQTGNKLEIDVVNLWPNRIIGDETLPPEKRYTRTNVKYHKDDSLSSSGLLGPVTLQAADRPELMQRIDNN